MAADDKNPVDAPQSTVTEMTPKMRRKIQMSLWLRKNACPKKVTLPVIKKRKPGRFQKPGPMTDEDWVCFYEWYKKYQTIRKRRLARRLRRALKSEPVRLVTPLVKLIKRIRSLQKPRWPRKKYVMKVEEPTFLPQIGHLIVKPVCLEKYRPYPGILVPSRFEFANQDIEYMWWHLLEFKVHRNALKYEISKKTLELSKPRKYPQDPHCPLPKPVVEIICKTKKMTCKHWCYHQRYLKYFAAPKKDFSKKYVGDFYGVKRPALKGIASKRVIELATPKRDFSIKLRRRRRADKGTAYTELSYKDLEGEETEVEEISAEEPATEAPTDEAPAEDTAAEEEPGTEAPADDTTADEAPKAKPAARKPAPTKPVDKRPPGGKPGEKEQAPKEPVVRRRERPDTDALYYGVKKSALKGKASERVIQLATPKKDFSVKQPKSKQSVNKDTDKKSAGQKPAATEPADGEPADGEPVDGEPATEPAAKKPEDKKAGDKEDKRKEPIDTDALYYGVKKSALTAKASARVIQLATPKKDFSIRKRKKSKRSGKKSSSKKNKAKDSSAKESAAPENSAPETVEPVAEE